MPTKREIVDQLKREELQDLTKLYDLEVTDRRVREELVDVLVRSKRARLVDILGSLSRDRLKEICVGLEMDDSGREKSLIIERLCGESDEEREDNGPGVLPLLTRLLGPSLHLTPGDSSWPARGTFRAAGRELPLDIYVRMVGGSARGNSLERRFQNPSKQSAIVIDGGRHALLLGLWTEQGEQRAVIVALDAYRRADRTTRFSLFMPLSLLEQAADTGFALHDNRTGERLYAFRPEHFERYLRAFFEAAPWQAEEMRAPATPTIIQEAPAFQDASLYIRPRVGMYAAFARLNYKPWFALAEFVDNSIQSFLNHRSKLVAAGHDGPLIIDVSIDENEISVTDRAGGIAWRDFPRAFSPAAPPEDATGLSEFGLGMKAAACWFSKRWSVRTSALGEPVERTVTFDVPKISRDGTENLPIEARPARESDHFTVVTMQDLRVRPRGRTLAKIKEHLASIYRALITDGVVRLRVTTSGKAEELRYEQPELLEAPYHRAPSGRSIRWRTDFTVDLHDKKVTGWAGILKTGSHSRAGFSVLRRQRLVEGSIGETYKPPSIFGSPNSFASQRVVGELFVEGFDVTHTKDGIQWGGHEDEILESIHRQLDSPRMALLDQAEGYRVRKTGASLAPNFGEEAVASTATALAQEATASALRVDTVAETTEIPPAQVHLASAPMQTRKFTMQVVRDARPWTIHLELVREMALSFYTTSVSSHDGQEVITVQLNLEHELSVAHINDNEGALLPVLKIVAALALGEKLARDAGVRNVGVVRQNANQILNLIARDGSLK